MFNFPEKNQLTSFWQTLKFFNRLAATFYKLLVSLLSKAKPILKPIFIFSISVFINALFFLAGWLFLAAIDGFAFSIAAAVRIYILSIFLLCGGVSLYFWIDAKDFIQNLKSRIFDPIARIAERKSAAVKKVADSTVITQAKTQEKTTQFSASSNSLPFNSAPFENSKTQKTTGGQNVRLVSYYIISEYQPERKEGE